jgi:hypothetical protein
LNRFVQITKSDNEENHFIPCGIYGNFMELGAGRLPDQSNAQTIHEGLSLPGTPFWQQTIYY